MEGDVKRIQNGGHYMAKEKTVFFCTSCGWEHAKWNGQCTGCKEWNTLEEAPKAPKNANSSASSRMAMAGGGSSKPTNMKDVKESDYPGFSTNIGELDRVLGGKMVHGSVTLIAGEPGKGKSTLLLQTAGNIAKSHGKVLYCTGEESELQVKNRAVRLGIDTDQLFFYNTEDLFQIEQAVMDIQPIFLVVDSIQHIANPEIKSELGSPSQIKNCTAALVTIAKKKGVSVFIVGHVTKDDEIGGPRKLEHMVDTVLYLAGDKTSDMRLLQCRKNRFGPDSELGVFRMEQEGMVEIKNPSEYLIANRATDSSGSAIVCISGTRPMLIEVQALVAATSYENAIPRRTSRGFERDRFNILVAVLDKRCGVKLATKDIFLNVVGGMDLEEPGSDLGVALSIVSSDKDVIIDPFTTIIGEVGLAGEVRPVPSIERLVKEAERNGFKRFVLPEKNYENAKKVAGKIEIIPVSKVKEAIKIILK